MQGRHSAIGIAIDDHTRATLAGWLRKQQTPVGIAKRAQAMLLLADGQTLCSHSAPARLTRTPWTKMGPALRGAGPRGIV